MGVSLIVPAYNAEKFLAATLESALAQTVRDLELVVVDDGSTDQTGTIADTFAHRDNRIRVLHQANAGIAQARNRGFAETRADYDYCLFLDSDDLLKPSALEILMNALEKNHGTVAAHGQIRFIDREGKPLGNHVWPSQRRGIQGHRLKLWPVSAPTTFAVQAYSNFIGTSTIMIRRAQKMAAGNFDPNTVPHDDWDMWLRLSRLGDIIFVNKIVLAYRLHENNISKNHQLMQDSELYVQKKMYRSPDLNEQERGMILTGYRYRQIFLARQSLRNAGRRLYRRKDAFEQLQLAMRHLLSALKGDL